jgi:hypothetical protein
LRYFDRPPHPNLNWKISPHLSTRYSFDLFPQLPHPLLQLHSKLDRPPPLTANGFEFDPTAARTQKQP